MTENETPTPDASPSGTLWSRYRIPIIFGAVAAWVAVIAVAKMRPEHAANTSKGASELLQIGALPVT